MRNGKGWMRWGSEGGGGRSRRSGSLLQNKIESNIVMTNGHRSINQRTFDQTFMNVYENNFMRTF